MAWSPIEPDGAWGFVEESNIVTIMRSLIFATVLAIATAPVQGQEPETQSDVFLLEQSPDSLLALALRDLPGTPLSLEEAFGAMREASTDLAIAEANLHSAKGARQRERGAFDPELFATYERREEEQPSASALSGAAVLETKDLVATGGARIRLPIGTDLTASLETVKRETNSSFVTLHPQYGASGTLLLRQPLLKGLGPGTWGELAATTREFEAARARHSEAVDAARAGVEQTYWDLYAAERDYAVQMLIRDRARALVRQVDLRAKAGIVGPNQVANARVFLAEQEQALLDREQRLAAESDRLASLIGRRPPSGSVVFRATSEPPSSFAVAPVESVVAHALSANRELRALERDMQAARSRARSAKWNALPAVDVVGSLGGQGLAGFIPDSLDSKRSDAIDDAVSRRFPNWSAGVVVSVPIGFREGAGERNRLRAEADRAEQEYIAAGRSLEERVRAVHRELHFSTQRLDAAREGADASLEQVRIGLLEYNNGRTTAFELVRLGADLASAQQRFSEALVRAAKAASELRVLTAGADPVVTSDGGSSTP